MPRALHNFSTVNYLDYLDQCSEQNISCMLGLPFQQVQQGKGAALAAQLLQPRSLPEERPERSIANVDDA